MPRTMSEGVTLVMLLPLLASIVIALLGPRLLKGASHWPAWIALGMAFFYAVVNLVGTGSAGTGEIVYEWINAGDFKINFALRSDALTALMLVMVTSVSLLVAIYSRGYVKGDPGYSRFFAEISLFVAAMTLLVLSSNFILLYLCWEAVGLCSYLLIGFWYQRPAAAAAARKAFLVNRIGDFGFALGIFLLWVHCGYNLDYDHVFAQAGSLSEGTTTLICLLLFLGAVGKSAQFPLHVWLPDAMEGPSPVSALIHAATMVTAGVYVVARCMPLFANAPIALLVVGGIGAITALLGALIAVTQNDLKRVLAYSTISQLGYMFMALATGADNRQLVTFGVVAAIFHLFTHAYFKALLFLAAGSVMHAMGDVIDVRRFSGLRRLLPYTHWTFLIGALALAGIVPFAGFWSKDEVLTAIHKASTGVHGFTFLVMMIIAKLTAFLTAFYVFRAYFLTFWGEEKVPEEAGHHAHESPLVMVVPLVILAVASALIGIVVGPTHWFAHLIEKTPRLPEAEPVAFDWAMVFASTGLALAGIGLAYLLYGRKSDLPAKLQSSFRGLYDLSLNKFYWDEIYQALIVRPLQVFASVCKVLDQYVVDGLVDLIGWSPTLGGQLFRGVQNGLVQFYALATLLGVVVFLIAVLYQLYRLGG